MSDIVFGIPVAIVYAVMVIAWMRKTYRTDFRWHDVPLLLSPSLCYILLWIAGDLLDRGGQLYGVLSKERSGDFIAHLVFLQVPYALWVVWRLRGWRLQALFLGGLHVWFSFVFAIQLIMSIHGTWL